MCLLALQGDLERTVAGGDGGGVVPLHVVRLPVVQIHSLPVGVIAGVERTVVDVEFVAENELPLFTGDEVGIYILGLWCIVVDKTPVAGHRGNLAGGIYSSQVETTEGRLRRTGEVGDQGIARTVEQSSAVNFQQ